MIQNILLLKNIIDEDNLKKFILESNSINIYFLIIIFGQNDIL